MSFFDILDFIDLLDFPIDLFTFRLIWFIITNITILISIYTAYQNIKLLKSQLHSNQIQSVTSSLIISKPRLNLKKFLCSYLQFLFYILMNPFVKLFFPPSESSSSSSSSPDISVSSSSYSSSV